MITTSSLIIINIPIIFRIFIITDLGILSYFVGIMPFKILQLEVNDLTIYVVVFPVGEIKQILIWRNK